MLTEKRVSASKVTTATENKHLIIKMVDCLDFMAYQPSLAF